MVSAALGAFEVLSSVMLFCQSVGVRIKSGQIIDPGFHVAKSPECVVPVAAERKNTTGYDYTQSQ